MFKKKKEKKDILIDMDVVEVDASGNFKDNVRTLKDSFAPSEVDIVDPSTLKVGEHYVRNYVMQGYPSYVRVGWLDELFNYSGDLDTTVLVEPSDDRSSIDELTKQITAIQAQYDQEAKEGKTSNLINYQDKINMLEEQRRKIELNYESMYNVGIFSNLSSSSFEDLNKRAEILESNMRGRRANFLPTNYRMLNGYKTALPLAENFFKDKLRNFTTGSLVACMPFIRGEICQPDGVYIGMNEYTGNNVMLNLYNKNFANNTNMSIFGRAGSGKSFFTSLLTMRSCLKSIQHLIIDPEGEYGGLAKALGGIEIKISADSTTMINPFDISEEEELDASNKPTGKMIVNLKDKYGDLVDLLSICAGDIDQEQRSLISSVVVALYKKFGINENPDSLYDKSIMSENGQIFPKGKPKRMPQFSDFYNMISFEINRRSDDPNDPATYALKKMKNKLSMFLNDQAYPLLDCQSSINIKQLQEAPIVVFNVSDLEEGTLRPIGMYIAMSYIWDKIIIRNYDIKKRVIVDEAWMFLNQNYAGHEYTSTFLEKCARRIRKRNAGLCVASQNFVEFTACSQGQAVLNNSAVKIFLKQSETDIDALQDKFKISDGEKNFLVQAKTGEILIKTDSDSAVCNVIPFPLEKKIIDNSKVHYCFKGNVRVSLLIFVFKRKCRI